MKHNLRAAFLSLLLVLTLGVMPVFAESADHAMDWTHGIGSRYRTDVTSALPFADDFRLIFGVIDAQQQIGRASCRERVYLCV